MTIRRHFLQGIGATLVAGHPASAIRRRRDRAVGLADYSVRNELAAGYEETLRKVKDIGYSHFGFRLGSYFASEPAEPDPYEKARLVRAAKLQLGPVRISPRLSFDGQVSIARAIGATELVMSAAPIYFGAKMEPGKLSLRDLDAFIVEMNSMGAQARKAGIRFTYHNHWFDSSPIEGIIPLHRMIARSNPRDVWFELDLAWTYLAGEDILALIRQLGPRLLSMHVKDIDKKRAGAPLNKAVIPGDGEMNYGRLLPKIRRLTNALPVVEIEPPLNNVAAARRAFNFIANIEAG